MKKSIGILILIIAVLALGYFSLSSLRSPESYSEEYFLDTINDYPWVRYAHNHQSEKELFYYQQLTFLYSINERIGFTLMNIQWVKDYITEEEARALALLVDISKLDSEVGLNIAQTVWFQMGISPSKVDIMEHVLMITEKDVQLAKNVTSASWFFIAREYKIQEMVETISGMPLDLALPISEAPWFISDVTLSESKTVQELITLYDVDKDLALELSRVYQSRDVEALQYITRLHSEEKELLDSFFEYNSLTRETFLALSGLSQIAEFDRELAYSLVGELTQDKIQIITSLADIYSHDPDLGNLAHEKFGNNRVALRYIQKVLEVDEVEPELLEVVAVFVVANSEFVYEDRIEPYRYHLLTQIIAEFPLDTAQSYKNLIFVTCSVYGNRFYLWQNDEYGTLEGWSSDRQLLDLEKKAVMDLLHFLTEKNEEGALAVDLRIESHEYLYGVLNIPFTHLVNYDGTTVGASCEELEAEPSSEPEAEPLPELGTSFVFATIYNINTLEQRFTIVQEQLRHTESVEYTERNPVVDLILEEGEERDVTFLYFCAKNWELGQCLDQAMHTRMDSIVMGISTTTMHWTAPESAHIYPAYIPSHAIVEKLQDDPAFYGNPFMYRDFVAPYDKAGFKTSIDRDIESIKIYDVQADRKINLFNKSQEQLIYDEKVLLLVLVGIGVMVIIVADMLKIIR